MLKVSLVVLFVMSMATLTIAASALPVPPDATVVRTTTLTTASLG
jgi:hypothetical protein